MDSHPYNINSAHEFRLRRHIHEVLLPYARIHLTTDHVAFTEAAVEELLLRNLEYVPMADATSFLLPTEPFEVLIRSLDALDLTPPPEEKWITPAGNVRYIRDFFSRPPALRELRSERCWYEEDDPYERLSALCRPLLTPILTRRSRLRAPRLGCLNYRATIPHTAPALTAFLDLKPVTITPVEEVQASAVDDVLDLCLKIDSATGTQVRHLLQSVVSSAARGNPDDPSPDAANVARFLNCVSPPRRHTGLESPPLFPRRRPSHPGASNGAKSCVKEKGNPARVSDLAPMLTPTRPELIDGEDGDYNDHHMEVVSGWATLTISSPAPPSAHSSDQSEVDELWDISPPGTPPTSLIAAKMDEVEIPRVRKFGHKNTLTGGSTTAGGAAELLVAAKSPGFFITSFISAPVPITLAPKEITSQLEVVKHSMQSPRPLSPDQTILNSLFGQPPTACEEQTNEEAKATASGLPDCAEELELDAVVAGLCASTPHDPLSCILEEKLDDKEIMLMDVPNLPPPTAHPKETAYFPQGMRSFVAPKGEPGKVDPGSNGVGSLAFLKPVKGIKPLALDLSWRPFNFGKTIPTDEDVAGVARPFDVEYEVPGYREQKQGKGVDALFDLVTSTTSSEEAQVATALVLPRRCEAFGMSPTPKRDEESGHVEYVLTNRERAEASGVKIMLETEDGAAEDLEPDWATEPRLQDDRPEYTQDLRMREEQQTSRTSFDYMNRIYGTRTSNSQFFDDSGIDIVDESRGRFVTSEFGSPVLLLEPGDKNDLRCALDELEANKENIDPRNENRENLSPWDDMDDQTPKARSLSLGTQYDWTEYIEYPESVTPPFEPLSFPSQSQVLGSSNELKHLMVQGTPEQPPSIGGVKRTADDLLSTNKLEPSSRVVKRRKLDDLVPTSSRDLFATFIGLRNQVPPPTTYSETPVDEAPTIHQTTAVSEEIPPRIAPNDVFDRNTARLPEHWIPATLVHRYLASMALIQKRALVRELQGEACRVLLVERYDLGGTDIIIDPDHGVLFVPLLALPANLEHIIERISCESWRYLKLFIVFEAYPSAQSSSADRSRETKFTPNAYTPPICKAIKKLRRNLGIAEGCGTMDPRCTTTWAFANDVGEAARFVRFFGEEARANAMGRGSGIIWDEREWLEEDEREGESDLAGVHGMNAFAAFVMLYNHSLEDILDLPSEGRLADFGQLLGQDRMVGLNAGIERRSRLLAADNADSVIGAGY